MFDLELDEENSDLGMKMLQGKEKELSEARAEKEKWRLLSEDLQLKVKAGRRDAEATNTALQNARRITT